MLKFNSKFSHDDNVLASFAQIIASPVCLAVIQLIKNQQQVTSKHIYTLPYPSAEIKEALADLEFAGIVKPIEDMYVIDDEILQSLSAKFKAFIHHLSDKK